MYISLYVSSYTVFLKIFLVTRKFQISILTSSLNKTLSNHRIISFLLLKSVRFNLICKFIRIFSNSYYLHFKIGKRYQFFNLFCMIYLQIKKLCKLRLIKSTTIALFFEHPMINNIDYNREEHLFLPSRYMHQSWDEYGEGFRDKIGGRWPRYYRLRVLVRARWRLLLYRLRFPPLDRLMIRSFHRRCCTWHSQPHHSQPHDARPLASFRFDIDKWEHSHIATRRNLCTTIF